MILMVFVMKPHILEQVSHEKMTWKKFNENSLTACQWLRK